MRALALLFLSSISVAAPAPKPTNLLVNGSFEEGPEIPDRFLSLEKGSVTLKGWKVTRGQIDLISTFWTSAHGKRSVDLHGSPGYGGVEQAFKTKKGTRYRVELQFAVTPGAGKRGIWIEAGGEKKKFEADSGEATPEKMGWSKVSWEFVATGDETTLEIYTTEAGDAAVGPAIDEVTVVER